MSTYTWQAINGGGFDDANSWNPAVVPVAGDVALLDRGGGTVGGSGFVDGLYVSGAAWTVTGALATNTLALQSGGLAVSGAAASLLVNAAFSVGPSTSLGLYNGAILSVARGATTSFGATTISVFARAVANFNGPVSFGSGGATSAAIDASVLTVGGVFSLGGAGGSASLVVGAGSQAIVNAAADATAPYLRIGAGGSASVQVDGSGSLLLLSNNSAAVGYAGIGQLDVTNAGAARFSSSNNGLNPALVLGAQLGASGVVNVTGAGSAITVNGSVVVGRGGAGSLRITGGGTLNSAVSPAAVGTQSAFSVAAAGSGAVVIDGAGSQLVASGLAVIGGDNRGSGTVGGGAGTVRISNGGALQTGAVTILAGSSVSLDGASSETIAGDLNSAGVLASSGLLSVSGAVRGAGQVQLGGGLATFGNLAGTNVSFTGAPAVLRTYAISGTNQISGLQFGDAIDLLGNSNVSISGNTVLTSGGSLVLSGLSSGQYTLGSDGAGGTIVTVGGSTVGVFRFFDLRYGTHFFSSDSSEKNTIMATRPDLAFEGVGLQAIAPDSADPNASPVYRFFDLSYGTHFFTASANERDTIVASRPDLAYEGTGFIEHVAQQPGDVAVYRFFDLVYGTHFYTADASERNTILATRPDLADEGIGFYAPST